MTQENAWISLSNRLPDNGIEVETKIEDEKGSRNETTLKRSNSLWMFPDGSMYVYYTPTHLRYLS